MAAVLEENRVARFSVHFDGAITIDHMLTVRMMARTYKHMQSTIDRAYLVHRYGSVWKHARLKSADYPLADFMAAYPREGGIVLDAVNAVTEVSRQIIDQISNAVVGPFDQALNGGLSEAAALGQQLTNARYRAGQIGLNDIPRLQDIIENPPEQWERAYSKRSICKEIDQLVSPIASDHLEGSIVEIGLIGAHARTVLPFTAEVARRFHSIVAARELGPIALVNAKIRDLDRGNQSAKPSAKILNIDSGREAILHLMGDADFHQLHPYHTAERVQILAAPFIEAGGFDVRGGDLFFVAVVG